MANRNGADTKLIFKGGGKVSVSVESIVNSPKVRSHVEAVKQIAASAGDEACICRGNWRAIVKESMPFYDRLYRDKDGYEWTFFGVVDSADDYYYGMSRDGQTQLLSCVGSIEGHGFELVTLSGESEFTRAPKEPTEEMIVAGMEKSVLGRPSVDDASYVVSIYKAMLAAQVEGTNKDL